MERINDPDRPEAQPSRTNSQRLIGFGLDDKTDPNPDGADTLLTSGLQTLAYGSAELKNFDVKTDTKTLMMTDVTVDDAFATGRFVLPDESELKVDFYVQRDVMSTDLKPGRASVFLHTQGVSPDDESWVIYTLEFGRNTVSREYHPLYGYYKNLRKFDPLPYTEDEEREISEARITMTDEDFKMVRAAAQLEDEIREAGEAPEEDSRIINFLQAYPLYAATFAHGQRQREYMKTVPRVETPFIKAVGKDEIEKLLRLLRFLSQN